MHNIQAEDPNGPAGYLVDKEEVDYFELLYPQRIAKPARNFASPDLAPR